MWRPAPRDQVHELKKRQARDREREVKRREKRMEKEKAEREATAKIRMEQEAYELQVGGGEWGCVATGAWMRGNGAVIEQSWDPGHWWGCQQVGAVRSNLFSGQSAC